MPLDRDSRTYVEQFAASGAKPLHECTVAEARERRRPLIAVNGPGPEMARVEDHRIGGEAGFPVRVFIPRQGARGVIVYYHGGGFVLGELDEYEALARKLAERTSCGVVLVGYRLAPEHPYPAAVDDSWAALEWTATNLASIAGAGVPLMVAGDSAGGALAAVVAVRARDRSGPAIALQVLVYPVMDADFDRSSYLDQENQLVLTRAGMQWFWGHYVPDPSRRVEPDASPLRAASLAGVAPAVVLTAEYDVLRDEGEEYARRLEAAGVPVDFKRYDGQVHGFLGLLWFYGGERGMQQIAKAVRACIVRHAKGAVTA